MTMTAQNMTPAARGSSTDVSGKVVRAPTSGVEPLASGLQRQAKATESLLACAAAGQASGVRAALAEGADVHAKNGRGLNAFELASGAEAFDLPLPKHPEVLEALRQHVREHPPSRAADLAL